MAKSINSAQHSALNATVRGLGYRLVDCQWSPRYGLLRLFVESISATSSPILMARPDDWLADTPMMDAQTQAINGGVSVEDCAQVSHHLSRWLAVEGIDYQRLEVSSPGLDRRISTLADIVRFADFPVRVVLKTAITIDEGEEKSRIQKNFHGRLMAVAGEEINLDPEINPTQINVLVEAHQLCFDWQDIDSVRLDEEALLNERYPVHQHKEKHAKKKAKVAEGKKAVRPLSAKVVKGAKANNSQSRAVV